jgi:hypothetical protein
MLEIYYGQVPRAALGEFVARAGTNFSIANAEQIDDRWPLVKAGAFEGDPEQARRMHAAVFRQINQTQSF